MKQQLLTLLLLFLIARAAAQTTPFRFAFLSDTHIGSPSGAAEEDLRRTVADINRQSGIAFVVVTGDITELGTDRELALARQILDSLNVPWYVIPGNHDTGWSGSGGLSVTKVFGYDRFAFTHGGIRFIGCASGPYVRMSDGHVPRGHVNWLKAELARLPKGHPVVFLNHYPLDNGLDNWYEVVDQLKQHNTLLALCGHGHSNRPVQAEEIPAVMGRSNLRAKESEGGYNLVDVRADSFVFTERRPLSGTEKPWRSVARAQPVYDRTKTFPRPDFSVNDRYPQVRPRWTYASAANIISTPVLAGRLVLVGNQDGLVEAFDLESGKRRWAFATGGPIFSSPAADGGRIVFGSADGHTYCLSDKGTLLWKAAAGAAVLGSPLVRGGVVYIGASDGRFRALDLRSGALRWSFDSLQGPVTGTPVLQGGRLFFGAWDRRLYALDAARGTLAWTWSNGSPVINYSPAACTPVVSDSVVYVVAPDRCFTAIDRATGATLWRTRESAVRESIGASEDGRFVYAKTMQDTIVAFAASRTAQPAAWKLHAGFGYEHVPSMLVERDGIVYFGTRNGVVYALNAATQTVRWAHKIDNSMVNTVRVLGGRRLLVSTMDGRLCLLEEK